MKNIKNFNEFINEEINWSKQPWRFLKNIMKLEEPEYDEDNEKVEDKNPNDMVTMTTNFQLSMFGSDTQESVFNAIELLAKKHHLIGTINHVGSMQFLLNFKGKRKDADSFYEELKNIIRN